MIFERPKRTKISIESWTKPGQRFLQQLKQHILAVVVFQGKYVASKLVVGGCVAGRPLLRFCHCSSWVCLGDSQDEEGTTAFDSKGTVSCFLLLFGACPVFFADRKRRYRAFFQEPTQSDLENEKSHFKDLPCQHCLVAHLKHGTCT